MYLLMHVKSSNAIDLSSASLSILFRKVHPKMRLRRNVRCVVKGASLTLPYLSFSNFVTWEVVFLDSVPSETRRKCMCVLLLRLLVVSLGSASWA